MAEKENKTILDHQICKTSKSGYEELCKKIRYNVKEACKYRLSKQRISYILKGETNQRNFRDTEIYQIRPFLGNFCAILFLTTCSIIVGLPLKSFVSNRLVGSIIPDSRCLLEIGPIVQEIARRSFDCHICKDLKSVPVVNKISREEFKNMFAYSSVPVLIKRGAVGWKAMSTFSYTFFKKFYMNIKGSMKSTDQYCEFQPFETEFSSLAAVFKMADTRANFEQGEKPWYIGWSNCQWDLSKKLSTYFDRPYFLPNDSESSRMEWIFMGVPGQGAPLHVDNIIRPSWQAQIKGTKTWILVPMTECQHICYPINVTVYSGDILVVDTNQWYHTTYIHPGELGISIGTEIIWVALTSVIKITVPVDKNLHELPCDFNKYDENKDQSIDIKEFAKIHGQTGEEEDAKNAFAFVDSDANGMISREEFKVAPIIKESSDCEGDESPILWTNDDGEKNN